MSRWPSVLVTGIVVAALVVSAATFVLMLTEHAARRNPGIAALSAYETTDGKVVTVVGFFPWPDARDSIDVQVTSLTLPGLVASSPVPSVDLIELIVEQPAPAPGTYTLVASVCVGSGLARRCAVDSVKIEIQGRESRRML